MTAIIVYEMQTDWQDPVLRMADEALTIQRLVKIDLKPNPQAR